MRRLAWHFSGGETVFNLFFFWTDVSVALFFLFDRLGSSKIFVFFPACCVPWSLAVFFCFLVLSIFVSHVPKIFYCNSIFLVYCQLRFDVFNIALVTLFLQWASLCRAVAKGSAFGNSAEGALSQGHVDLVGANAARDFGSENRFWTAQILLSPTPR